MVKGVNEVLPAQGVQSSNQVGGRLQKFWPRWKEIGINPQIVQILKEGYILPFKEEPPVLSKTPIINSSYVDPIKNSALIQQVQKLLEKGAIEEVQDPSTPGFYSRIFLVPKKDDWRPIIDLSSLNKYLYIPKFKMETPESVRTSIQPGEWLTSIDLTDAYLHVPMHPKSKKYLRFMIGKKVYQFRVLPFGLATAPYLFTKIVKALKEYFTTLNLIIHQFLDDWINRTLSFLQGVAKVNQLKLILEHLGFLINYKKSQLIPTQSMTFIGYHYNLLKGIVLPPEDRVTVLQQEIPWFLSQKMITVRNLMHIIGLLAATEKMVPYGRLHMRPLQLCLNSQWDWKTPLETPITLDQPSKEALIWWSKKENLLQGSPLHPENSQIQIFTDASNIGWGAHCLQQSIEGVWALEDQKRHINVLEMKAAWLALQHFQNLLKNKVVLLSTDNSTVATYINKQGGTKSVDLCALTWRILTWTKRNNITLSAKHIPGCLNVMADLLSRSHKVLNTEWSLNPQIFRELTKKLGTPNIDMFATYLNNKLPTYVSPFPDPAAWAMDAMSIDWTDLHLYAYPPTNLLTKVISKIRREPCKVLLIAPLWPQMPWFPDLQRLIVQDPIKLPQVWYLLKQPHKEIFNNHLKFMNLHAFQIQSYP